MRWRQLERARTLLGDYGDAIVHGYCEDAGDELLLMRCGPGCPGVSLPPVRGWGTARIVVTTAVRGALEADGFSELGWGAVRKHRIVKLDGERCLAEGYAEFRGEPESLVMRREGSGEGSRPWWSPSPCSPACRHHGGSALRTRIASSRTRSVRRRGSTYDAPIAACARKARATRLVTFNPRHFERLDLGDVVLVVPATP